MKLLAEEKAKPKQKQVKHKKPAKGNEVRSQSSLGNVSNSAFSEEGEGREGEAGQGEG